MSKYYSKVETIQPNPTPKPNHPPKTIQTIQTMVKFVSYAGIEAKVKDVEPTTTFLQVFPQLRAAFKADKTTMFHGINAQTKEKLTHRSLVQNHKEILVAPKPSYWKVGDRVNIFHLLFGKTGETYDDPISMMRGQVVHVTPTGKPHIKHFAFGTHPDRIIKNINYSRKYQRWQFKIDMVINTYNLQPTQQGIRYMEACFTIQKV